ncbi:hypothetical protein G6045_39330 [Streptomyces sp. YC504]|uniref:Uncharacterized protein n=1 Tax=Streptomyces mesophilus TaxID=1775132 RepID=A0A6G4XYI8_9ACTN|nr:hypothetical protein [Streptomyces mesophilus]NGO81661.1 hypothetical protein [Streptomyces mesophilus]
MPAKKVRSRKIQAEDISSAGIASLVVTAGFNLGANTWPGKLLIWSSIFIVLLLPPLVAAALNVIDDALKYWQWKSLRNSLEKILHKTADPVARAKLEEDIKKADQELSTTTLETMRGIHAEEAEG